MSDLRFTRLKTDPRFRRPKKKQQKVVIDERFKSVFDHTNHTIKDKSKARVDKYGRKLSETHEEDNLKRYYRLARRSDQQDEQDNNPKTIDYARGEALMESSDEQDSDLNHDNGESTNSDSSDIEEIIRIGGEEDELDIDLDEDTNAELDAQIAAYKQANKDLTQAEDHAGLVNCTRRLAVVNLDWDHVRAVHLYKIFASLVSPTAPYIPISATHQVHRSDDSRKSKSGASPIARGAILSVRVYPSEFGQMRMKKEEREGPPSAIFKKKRKENDEINEKTVYEVGDEDEYDEDALRRYQLERLKYFYAIVECDTTEAASHIYSELDGTELERSANIFDLSFVPDDMTFDIEPRDEANEELSISYKPVDYVTDALRHSKVKLTWDEDDPERYQITRRQLTWKEIEEADFKTYIASSSSEDETGEHIRGANPKKGGKETSHQKLRALLLGGNNDTIPERWNLSDEGGDDVDMEITFNPGLSDKKTEEGETTLENYRRKTREHRKKKKEERKLRLGAAEEKNVARDQDNGGGTDDFFDSASDGGSGGKKNDGVGDKLREARKDKRTGKQTKIPQPRKESTVEELALVVSPSHIGNREPNHFDMKAVLKAEKRTGRKRGKAQPENELQEDFEVNVTDERFRFIHEDHKFAIDPTNPQFRKTKGMTAFLEERRRRQAEPHEIADISSDPTTNSNERNLKSLVESVKRKSQQGQSNQGKRRRI